MADKKTTSIDVILRIIDKTQGQVKKFVKDMNAVKNAEKGVNAETKKLTAAQKRQAQTQKSVNEQLKRTAKDTTLLAARNKKLANSIKGLTSGVSKATKQFKSFRLGMKKTAQGSKSADRVLKQTKSTVSGLAVEVGILAAALATVFAPVAKAAEFQRTMSEVKAISGAVGDEFKRLEKTAFDLGATTEFTAVQAGEGLRFLAMAGLNVEQSISALPSVLQVAQAGALELGRAADLVTNIMTGFRFEAEELGHVNDVLVQTFTNTNSTLDELGFALAYVGPIAAGLGADFEDLVATLGALHNAGLKGTLAGTALRGMLGKLFNPTKAEAQQMKILEERMGGVAIKLRDSEGDFVGFVEVIKQLEQANLEASEALELFGLRAGPGMAALLGIGSNALNDFVRLNEQAEGRAAKIAEVMHKNVVGSFKDLKSAAVGLAITIGNQLLPVLDSLVKAVTDIVRSIQLWANMNPTLTKVIVYFISTLAILVASIKAYTIAAGLATLVTGKFGFSMKSGAVSSGLFAKSIGKAAFALKGFIALAAAFIAGWSIGRWISDTEKFRNSFGHTIGEVVEIMTGQMFIAFEKAKFWFMDTFWYTPREALGLAIDAITTFARTIGDAVTKVPGLGKLWGWEADLIGITGAMEDMEKVGLEMANNAVKDREKVRAAMNKELNIHNSTINKLYEQGRVNAKIATQKKAQADYDAILKQRELVLQQRLKDATQQIDLEIRKSTNSWNEQQKKLIQVRSEFTRFADAAKSDLSALKKAVDRTIGAIWEGIDADAGTAALRQALSDVNTAMDMSMQERAKRTIEIENEISEKRIEAVKQGLDESIVLLDKANQKELKLEELLLVELGKTEESKTRIQEKHEEKIRGINEKTLQKKKEYYERASESLANELEKSLTHEQNLANQIIALQEKVLNAKSSAEEKIRNLRRKGLSEEAAYNDRVAEVREKIAQAETLAPEDLNKAIQLFKEAQSAAAGLVGEVKEGDKVIKTEQETIARAISLIEESQAKMESAAQAGKVALEGQLNNQKAQTEGIRNNLDTVSQKLSEVQAKAKEGAVLEVKIQIEDLDEQIKKLTEGKEILLKAKIEFDEATEALGELNRQKLEIQKDVEIKVNVEFADQIESRLDSLKKAKAALKEPIEFKVNANTVEAQNQISNLKKPTSSVHTVHVRRIDNKAIGGLVEKFAAGGQVFKKLASSFIPGNGIKDDVPAMLMKGEYVIRKAAVQKLGVPLLNALNTGRADVDMVPKFAKGGLAGLTAGISLMPDMKRKIQLALNPFAPLIKNGVAFTAGDPTFSDHIHARTQGVVTPGGNAIAKGMVGKFTQGVQKLQTGGSISQSRSLYERERQLITSEYNKKISLAQANGDNDIANLLIAEEEQLLSIAEELELTLQTLALELEQTIKTIDDDYDKTQTDLTDTFADTSQSLAKQKLDLERNHVDSMAEINKEMAILKTQIASGEKIKMNRSFVTRYGRIERPLNQTEREAINSIDVNKNELAALQTKQKQEQRRFREDWNNTDQNAEITQSRYVRDQEKATANKESSSELAIRSSALNVAKAENEAKHDASSTRNDTAKQISETSFKTQKEVLTLQSQMARELIALEKALAAQQRQQASGGVRHFLAAGGPIFKRKEKWIPGEGYKDDVPAMLMKGEYVVRKSAVKKFGVNFFDMLNSGNMPGMASGGMAGFTRKMELMLNPLSSYSNSNGVVMNINNPTFQNHVADTVNGLSSPIAKMSSKNMLGTFTGAVMKLQEGGDIGGAAQRLAAEKALVTREYQSRIQYARDMGQEDIAYALEQEQIELEQLAEDLRFTLEELEAEYAFARAQAEIARQQSITEVQYAFESSLETLRQKKADLEAEYETAKQQAEQNLIASNAAFREARQMPSAIPQYRTPEEAFVAAISGKFVSPTERTTKNQALRAARQQAMNQALLQRKVSEDALKFAELDFRKDTAGVGREINVEKKNYGRELKGINQQYEADNEEADSTFSRGTKRAQNEASIGTKKINSDTKHQVSKATIAMEAEIRKLGIELEKELFKLDTAASTAKFSGVRHFLNEGGPVNFVDGAKKGIDSVKAMLTPGEFVLKESAAKMLGLDFLNMLNNLKAPLRFAEGGAVGKVPEAVSSALPDYSAKVTFNVGGKDYGLRGKTSDARALVKQLNRLGLRVA